MQKTEIVDLRGFEFLCKTLGWNYFSFESEFQPPEMQDPCMSMTAVFDRVEIGTEGNGHVIFSSGDNLVMRFDDVARIAYNSEAWIDPEDYDADEFASLPDGSAIYLPAIIGIYCRDGSAYKIVCTKQE